MKFLTAPALSALTNCISQREVGDVTYDGRVELYSLKETGDDQRLKKELEEALAEEEGLRRDRSSSFSVAIADLQSSPVSSDTGGASSERAPAARQRVPSHTPAVDHRTLYFLISTLNASYPDYDFRLLRPGNFVRIDTSSLATSVYGSVNASLAELDREESARPMLPAELEAVAAEGGEGKPPHGGAGAGGKPGRAKRLLAAEPAAAEGAAEGAGKRGAGARARPAQGGKSAGSYGPHFLSALWHILEGTITPSECEVFSYVPDMDADPLSAGRLWSFNFFFLHRRLNRVLYFAATAQPGGAQRKPPGYGGASAVGAKFLRRRPAEGEGAAKEGSAASARPAPLASPSPLEEDGEEEDDRLFAGGAEGGEEEEGEEGGGGRGEQEGKDGADDAAEEQFEEEEAAAAVAASRARGKRRKLSSPARRGGRASSPVTEAPPGAEDGGEPGLATLLQSVASPAAIAPRRGRTGFRR